MNHAEIEQAVDSIWALFRETDKRLDRRIQETDRRFQETDIRIEEAIQGIQDLRGRFEETDRRMDERSKKTEREIEALAAQTRAAEDMFIGKWGRLLEAPVKPGVIELFRARGIDVTRTLQRVEVRRGGGGDGDRFVAGGRRFDRRRGGEDHPESGGCA